MNLFGGAVAAGGVTDNPPAGVASGRLSAGEPELRVSGRCPANRQRFLTSTLGVSGAGGFGVTDAQPSPVDLTPALDDAGGHRHIAGTGRVFDEGGVIASAQFCERKSRRPGERFAIDVRLSPSDAVCDRFLACRNDIAITLTLNRQERLRRARWADRDRLQW